MGRYRANCGKLRPLGTHNATLNVPVYGPWRPYLKMAAMLYYLLDIS